VAYGNRIGRARLNPRKPSAFGVCDRCGTWYLLNDLGRQFQWTGPALQDLGILVCARCNDVPQEQFRTVILPPDPVPRINPRPEVYVLGAPAIGRIPSTKSDALAAIAAASGVATPGTEVDQSITIATAQVSQQVMAANVARSWVALYNPFVSPIAIATGAAVWGADTNVMLGPGQAMFWATAQGNGTPWAGVLSAVSLAAGTVLWAWEA
jgi:hypothetical protein